MKEQVGLFEETSQKGEGKPYKHKIGGRTYWSWDEYPELLNKKVIVTYEEADNPKGEWPIKNIKEIHLSVNEEVSKVADKPKDDSDLFKLVFGQAMEHARWSRAKMENDKLPKFEEHFKEVERILWNLAVDMKKRRLG